MPLTLSKAQRDFMSDRRKVSALAAWVIRDENHIAARIRDETSIARVGNPTPQVIQRMVNYLSRPNSDESDLVHLINGFNTANQTKR